MIQLVALKRWSDHLFSGNLHVPRWLESEDCRQAIDSGRRISRCYHLLKRVNQGLNPSHCCGGKVAGIMREHSPGRPVFSRTGRTGKVTLVRPATDSGQSKTR